MAALLNDGVVVTVLAEAIMLTNDQETVNIGASIEVSQVRKILANKFNIFLLMPDHVLVLTGEK